MERTNIGESASWLLITDKTEVAKMIDKDGVLRLGNKMVEVDISEKDKDHTALIEKHINQLRVLQKNFQKWADENETQAEDECFLADYDRSYYSGVAHGLREASNYIASLL